MEHSDAPGAAISDDDDVDDGVHDAVPEGEGTNGCQVLQEGATQQQDAAEHHVGPGSWFASA